MLIFEIRELNPNKWPIWLPIQLLVENLGKKKKDQAECSRFMLCLSLIWEAYQIIRKVITGQQEKEDEASFSILWTVLVFPNETVSEQVPPLTFAPSCTFPSEEHMAREQKLSYSLGQVRNVGRDISTASTYPFPYLIQVSEILTVYFQH